MPEHDAAIQLNLAPSRQEVMHQNNNMTSGNTLTGISGLLCITGVLHNVDVLLKLLASILHKNYRESAARMSH